MTTTALQPLITTPSVPNPAPLARVVARLVGHCLAGRDAACTAMAHDRDLQALHQLDARQRADIGVDLLALTPAQPTFEVERGLIDRLMALR